MQQHKSADVLLIKEDGITLEANLDDDWKVSYSLAWQDGRFIVAEMHVTARPKPPRVPPPSEGSRQSDETVMFGLAQLVPQPFPRGGLSTRVLRRVRLGHDIRSIAGVVDEVRRRDPKALEPDGWLGRLGVTREAVASETAPATTRSGRGRPPLPKMVYAEIAARYVDAIARGSRRPIEDIAAALGENKARVRARINKARDLKFLTPGVQGNAGGQLTAAAKRLLRTKGGRHGKKTRTR